MNESAGKAYKAGHKDVYGLVRNELQISGSADKIVDVNEVKTGA